MVQANAAHAESSSGSLERPARRLGTSMSSQAGHGASVKLRIDNFTNDFDDKVFIHDLTHQVLKQAQMKKDQFNPTPFLDIFDSGLEELLQLKRAIRRKMTDLEETTENLAQEQQRHVNNLHTELNEAFDNFETLSQRVSAIGQTAFRVGEQLETLSRHRDRCAEARTTLSHIEPCQHGDVEALDALRASGKPEDLKNAAAILRRLNAISQSLDMPAMNQAVHVIQRYCEEFEREMLGSFERSQDKQDIDTMRECANVLWAFNDGESCIRAYVNQHPFFLKHMLHDDTMSHYSVDSHASNQLSQHAVASLYFDASQKPLPVTLEETRPEPLLMQLYSDIMATCTREWRIIMQVFESVGVTTVLQSLLQRIFAQTIQQHVDMLLRRAEQHSIYAGLQCLASCYEETQKLCQQLTALFHPSASGGSADDPLLSPVSPTTLSSTSSAKSPLDDRAPKGPVKDTPMGNGAKPQPHAAAGAQSNLATSRSVLHQWMYDIFARHVMDLDRYLDKERRAMESLCSLTMSTFLKQQAARQKETGFTGYMKQGRDFWNRAVHAATSQPSSEKDRFLDPASTATTQQRTLASADALGTVGIVDHAIAQSIGELSLAETEAASMSASTSKLTELFTFDHVPLSHIGQNMNQDIYITPCLVERCILGVQAASIRRALTLVSDEQRPYVIGSLFRHLLDALGRRYIESNVDLVIDDLARLDPKVPPDARHLRAVRAVCDAIRMIQLHFQNMILPHVESHLQHRETLVAKNAFFASIEQKVNTLLRKQIHVIAKWLCQLLSNQKKSFFKPKEDELNLTSLASDVCLQVTEFLESILAHISACIDGKNFDTVVHEIGVTFHGMLLAHIRKFTISETGGLMLTKDIAKYQDCIKLFKQQVLDDRFQMLRELGNLYLVRPENLRSLVEEGHLAKIDTPTLFHQYLSLRSDFKTAKIEQLFSDVQDQGATLASTASGAQGADGTSFWASSSNILFSSSFY